MNVQRVLVASVLLFAAAAAVHAGDGVAVIIGVRDGGAGGEVATAEADARAIETALTDRAGFAPARTLVMTGESPVKDRPTPANIKARIEEAAKSAAAGDRLLVYFTGRAAPAKDDLTLVPTGGAGRGGVSLAWVVETLAKSAAGSKAVILDLACDEEDAKDIADAGAKAVPAATKVALMLATGSRAVNVTEDGDDVQRSSFSVTAGKALSGKADLDGDSAVTMHELNAYLRSDLVWRRAKGIQGYGLLVVGGAHADAKVELAKQAPVEENPEEEKAAAEEIRKRGTGLTRAEEVRACTKEIRRNPGSADAWYSRGFAYFCLGRNPEAYADWTECIELEPKHSYALNMRGNLLVGWHLFDEALADLDKTIELEPDLPYPYNHRGRVFSAQGKLESAVENFTKAIQLLGDRDDEWLIVHLGRAKVYYRLKEFDKAWADVKFCRKKKIPVPQDLIRDLEEATGKADGE